MKTKFQMNNKKERVVTTDSGGAKKIKREWLPREILSCFGGKWINYIEKVDKDINDQWNAVTIKIIRKQF